MRLRLWLVIAVGMLAVVLLTGRAVTAVIVEHAWYSALDASSVFWEQLVDVAILQGGAWLIGALFVFANLHAVRTTIVAVAVPSRVANIEFTSMMPAQRLLSITVVLSIVAGFAMALPLTEWSEVAMARHAIPFGEIEGILDRDLGFYVFQLPLEETAYVWWLSCLVITIAMVLVLYALTRSLRWEGRRAVASTHVRRHMSVLGAGVLLLFAWSYRLDTFDLLQNGTGPDGLFLRVDHVVSLQADRVLVVICTVAAPVFLRAAWIGQLRAAFITLSLVLCSALGGRQILPILLNRGDWVGDPARRDLPYVASRTLYSRRAYDADAIRVGAMSPNAPTQGPSSRVRELPTLAQLPARVSLWDGSVSRDGGRDNGAVATSTAAGLGWTQMADGHIAGVLVRRPGSNSDRWTIALADLTLPRVRDSVLDLNIASRGEEHDDLSEPIAAPGLRGHRLVRDPAGVRGALLRGLSLRVAHAWAMRDPSLLDADTISGPAPRLVSYRDVRERVARMAPVFAVGDDVQPILADDQIIWAVNLYSASNRYPLSQHWTLAGSERSYFRFAATALVDANTGRVRFVASDRLDPIARSWFALVPSLVIAARDLAPSVADLLPAPTEGSVAQLRTFARHGSRFEGSVVRHLPDSASMGSSIPPHLFGSNTRGTTAWSVPLVDGGDTLDGVISSVGGRQRATYWDSTTGPPVRWSALADRLRVALDSVRARAAENGRRDSRTRLGRINVLPTDHGPVLVQSLILSQANGAPFVSQVAVLDGSRLAISATVGDAVAALRGVLASPKRATDWLVNGGAARDQQVTRLYDIMRDAMRSGDWLHFGAAFDSLGLVLGKPSR